MLAEPLIQSQVSVKELIEVGAHFGHPTAKWNPKMTSYIHDARNGIYIIDLKKTVIKFRSALDFLKRLTSTGQKVLFVGTKKQAKEIIKEQAIRCGQPWVAERWIGGTLTNFHTIKRSIGEMKMLQKMQEEKAYGLRKKKEILLLEKKRKKLEVNLLGIQDMTELPGALFIIDPNREYIAVNEAHTLSIPIMAVVDTNCNPDGITYPVPGNDDSMKAIAFYASKVVDAVLEGTRQREIQLQQGHEVKKEIKEKPFKKGSSKASPEILAPEREKE